MDAQRNAPGLAGHRGERFSTANTRPQFTKKSRPAYAQQFRADENGFAILCIGWPPTRPPAQNVLCLPPDVSPDEINWRCLKGLHVFATPTPGASVPHDLLRELGGELVAAGVASLVLFDGAQVVSEFWRAGSERPGCAHE